MKRRLRPPEICRLVLLSTLLLLAVPSFAAGPQFIQQSGQVTPGHPLAVVTNDIARDGGPPSPSNGALTGLGVVNSTSAGLCDQNVPTSQPFTSFCMGFVAGVPTLSVFGPSGTASLNVSLNGTVFPISNGGSGAGTVTGAPQYSLPYYIGSGTSTVLGGLAVVPNAVVSTGATGIPIESATLPTGLTIPAATMSAGSMTGGGAITGSYTGPMTLTSLTAGLQAYTISTLPASPTPGTMVYVSNCVPGSGAAGCPYYANSAGVWVASPAPTTFSVTVGGQTLTTGQSTTNQGNGGKIQLATGTTTTGHALAYDANGNAVDSGVVPSGGTGGGGTVANGLQYSVPYYTNSGTASVVGALSIVNNAVLATSGAGIPAEVTTLPAGLTIPTPTISSPTISGATLTGTTSVSGGGTISGTYAGPMTLNSLTAGLASYTIAGLPSPTASELVYVSNCSSGGANGCPYYVNAAGAWVPLPPPVPLSVTVGGQVLANGGATVNQGNGPLIQLAGAGTKTAGHALAYDASGNAIDSGVTPSGGTGGSGTVTSALQYSIPYYTVTGTSTVIGGLAIVNNAVLSTGATGIPIESATLPAGLTIPSPLMSNVTLSGSTALSGGGTVSGIYAGPMTLTGLTAGLAAYTTSSLPTPTPGSFIYVSNCTPVSGAAGCPYYVNSASAWVPLLPSPTTISLTVGGQVLANGGSTSNQGNGSLLQLASGSHITGHALAYDASGNAVDSGVVPSGGTGGGGTVSSGLQNSIPYYTNTGTAAVVGALSIVDNAVLVTSNTGVPSEATTLPTALIIPSPTISGATMTGTTSLGATTWTGKPTFLASTTGSASINLPPGVTPTSPVNGDIWVTSAGLFGYAAGITEGPFVYSVTGAPPLAGGGVGPQITLSCPTCVTVTGGGALAATSPIILTGNTFSLASHLAPLTWIADAATVVHNDTYNLIESWTYTNPGTVYGIIFHTGGTATPSFTIGLAINGTPVTGCTGLIVSLTTDVTDLCTAAKTINNGQTLSMNISSTSGSPSSAVVQTIVSVPGI